MTIDRLTQKKQLSYSEKKKIIEIVSTTFFCVHFQSEEELWHFAVGLFTDKMVAMQGLSNLILLWTRNKSDRA
jgi:hypothetical protein